MLMTHRSMIGSASDIKVDIGGVSKAFRHPDGRAFWALRDFNLAVKRGEFICLAGPSGCGKSTILNILSGLDPAFAGTARIDGQDVRSLRDGRALCSYVFQEPRLLPWLTIERNLQFVLESHGFSKDEQADKISSWLKLVGLSRFAKSYPHQLSGGMQQRASIARAFAAGHDLLLMDEPFSALDELTARSMRSELLELRERQNNTVIFVTHNLREALFLADRVLLMTANPGRVYRELRVDLHRPRKLDDEKLFEMSRSVTEEFLRVNAQSVSGDAASENVPGVKSNGE
jgi:ABC-type nitrate/sulfonate/bicarbonate transport system ATPase subunit